MYNNISQADVFRLFRDIDKINPEYESYSNYFSIYGIEVM